MQETEKIWMNGELVDWADAKVHVGTHGLHYGSGVFEGIRCYETDEGPRRLPPHATTCSGSHNSAKLLYMELPYSVEELGRACHELIGGERAARSATSARSRSTATASSASQRAATRSTS